MMTRILKISFWIFSILLVVALALAILFVLPVKPEKNENVKLGLTFSTRASEFLGLDWKKNYLDILNEINPEIIRIPVYWDRLEPTEGEYNWSDFDFQMEQLEGRRTQAILVVGIKLPRWPECHQPEWIDEYVDSADIQGVSVAEDKLFKMIQAVVNRYKDHPNLYSWQVENELLFPFGECPEWVGNRNRLKREIAIVREADDNHPVMTSDSGELSTWARTATLPIDVLGSSLYTTVYNEKNGYSYWPVNPYFYKFHIASVKPLVDEVIISELQLEPWGPDVLNNLEFDEIYKSFSPHNFDEKIDFAQRTGASTVLGWGAEWWYYMKEKRDFPDYWQKAVEYMSE